MIKETPYMEYGQIFSCTSWTIIFYRMKEAEIELDWENK